MLSRSLSGRRELLSDEVAPIGKEEKQGQILTYLETLEKKSAAHMSRLQRLYAKLQPVMENASTDESRCAEALAVKGSRVADRLRTLISDAQAQTEIVEEILAKVQL